MWSIDPKCAMCVAGCIGAYICDNCRSICGFCVLGDVSLKDDKCPLAHDHASVEPYPND